MHRLHGNIFIKLFVLITCDQATVNVPVDVIEKYVPDCPH